MVNVKNIAHFFVIDMTFSVFTEKCAFFAYKEIRRNLLRLPVGRLLLLIEYFRKSRGRHIKYLEKCYILYF